jgi:hypothetical protein
MVPSTAATNLRAGAMGRPFWFAKVDLPVVTDRLFVTDCERKWGTRRVAPAAVARPIS